ncbi:adenosine deaminase cecr1-like protein [Lasius niger]|uniref:Adenosine deaminase cecr1-like protein n=1 Tax=Lasius niger TaxID=67767 RepID=A0A0J7K117_LASNI|nr:adenosine deaminase cecr1-like protein [Lasius niger]
MKILIRFSNNTTFLPSRNFLEVISEIEKSEVFKILRELPKGAVLHAHEETIVSLDYKLNNVSYRENLYVCDRNNSLKLKFFNNPDETCDWQLLSEVRQDLQQAEAINDRIRQSLTMITENPRSAYPTVDKAWEKIQEDKGEPLIKFADKLNAVSTKIKFFFHAGETNWNGLSTDLNLLDALLLNTKRIGHGYALTKHPLLWNLVQQKGIAVEICPISNQVLSLVEDMRNHPATTLFASGSPIVISSDDPGLWGVKGLSYDFYEAFMGLMSATSDLRSLKQLAMNSLIYSSMNDQEKNDALVLWQDKWDVFVNKLADLFLNDNRWQRLFHPSLYHQYT